MPALIELLAFLTVAVLLVVVLARAFGKPASSARPGPSVKLVRTARTSDGHEETRLLINDLVILNASNDGVRLAEYADEVEQLEAVAARVASSLGVTVEFARVGARPPGADSGIPVRDLPDQQEEDLATRRARLDDAHDGA